MSVKAWVATAAKQEMVVQDIDLGPLGTEDVEVGVEHCGLCHSDVSVLDNDWGISQYPSVLGHEVVGRVTAVGTATKGVKVGQQVGVGWTAASCMHCRQCLSGEQHLCAENGRPLPLGLGRDPIPGVGAPSNSRLCRKCLDARGPRANPSWALPIQRSSFGHRGRTGWVSATGSSGRSPPFPPHPSWARTMTFSPPARSRSTARPSSFGPLRCRGRIPEADLPTVQSRFRLTMIRRFASCPPKACGRAGPGASKDHL